MSERTAPSLSDRSKCKCLCDLVAAERLSDITRVGRLSVATVTTDAATGTPVATVAMKNINLCFDYEGLNVSRVLLLMKVAFCSLVGTRLTDCPAIELPVRVRVRVLANGPFPFNRLLVNARDAHWSSILKVPFDSFFRRESNFLTECADVSHRR
jgi:hypothetical protein